MSVTIHQALHGYSEGHRQLASSASLNPRDARLLLVMSDVAGPGIASTGLPYLTGYPLVDSGMYALSMTWPAPEMPRPGCVWTHTLLISFADLALMDVPSALAALFVRPTENHLKGYEASVTINFSSPFREQLDIGSAKYVALFASALYGHPGEQIWARRPIGVDVDDIVLRMWDQQWPRLRRSFKFCTLTSRDRSQDVLLFDLQLTMTGNLSSQLRFASNLDGFEAVDVQEDIWLSDLVRDVVQPTRSSLRQMLRILGADVLGGREAMSPICTLHALIEAGSPQSLTLAVHIATQVVPLSSSDIAKGMVLRTLLDSDFSIEVEHVLSFVLEHFGTLSVAEAAEKSSSLARLVWKADPRTFVVKSYDGAEEIRRALQLGAASIDIESVLAQLAELADLAEPLLHLFPALAKNYRFWSETQSWPSSVASLGVDISGPETLRALIAGLRDQGAINSALHVYGTSAVLTCLEDLLSHDGAVTQPKIWVHQACVDVHGVANFLSHNNRQSRSLLLLLSQALSPDAIPNNHGDDPWFLALQCLKISEGDLPVELSAYGFRRALGWRSRSVEPLLRITFESLHAAAAKGAVPTSSWSMLEGSLPWVSSSELRDNCLKLRCAVAKKCVDLPATAEGFVGLVGSDELFLNLLDAVWQLWSGRRYLRSVKDRLDQSPRAQHAQRRKMIKRFLKDHSLW